MLTAFRHDDVTELRLASVRSRLSGMRVRAFVVRGVLIDAGFPTVASELVRWVAAHPMRGAALTHAHEDHAGGASALARLGVPLWMSERTRERLVTPAPVLWYRRFAWGSPVPLGDHRVLALPPELEAIATPGHSSDHHIIWDRETGTVFGGDLFIGVKVRLAHLTEDPYATVASLRRVIALAPRRYFDAHRGLLAHPVALLAAKADWMEATIAQCERLIAGGHDDASVARRALGADRIARWYTAGDYTKLNWVRGVRRSIALRMSGKS
jgi:glyoxylase-like metal-dependent hydrolase (beta-lactamase superfamily II)